MKENPFASPETTTESVASAQRKSLAGRGFEIVHNIFRGLLAFFCIGFIPIFIVPQFKDMFEEFGIELPWIMQWVIQFSSLTLKFPYAYLLLSLNVFACIEFGIFRLPPSRSKTLVNVGYWLILILVIGLACFSLFSTLNSLTTGLTGA